MIVLTRVESPGRAVVAQAALFVSPSRTSDRGYGRDALRKKERNDESAKLEQHDERTVEGYGRSVRREGLIERFLTRSRPPHTSL